VLGFDRTATFWERVAFFFSDAAIGLQIPRLARGDDMDRA
jgi:hypothetical protein